MNRWWVDEPAVIGCASPSDADLDAWRAEGFSVIVCLLDLEEQQPNYDRERAAAAGWEWRNIPIRDFEAPTLEQIEQLLTLLHTSLPQKKVVIHCRGGIGRTGTMAAAYWIDQGLSAQSAITQTRQRRPYAVENRHQEAILREFEKSRQK